MISKVSVNRSIGNKHGSMGTPAAGMFFYVLRRCLRPETRLANEGGSAVASKVLALIGSRFFLVCTGVLKGVI